MGLVLLIALIYSCLIFFYLSERSDNDRPRLSNYISAAVFGFVHSFVFIYLSFFGFTMMFWGALGAGMTGGAHKQDALYSLVSVIFFVVLVINLLGIQMSLAISRLIRGVAFGAVVVSALLMTLCDAGLASVSMQLAAVADSTPGLNKLTDMREHHHVGFINKKGEVVIPANYSIAGDFREGLALVRESLNAENLDQEQNFFLSEYPTDNQVCQCSFVDRHGSIVIDKICTKSKAFSDGLLPYFDEQVNLFGYVDKTGKQVLAPKFQRANDFTGGVATVQAQDAVRDWIGIDKSGKHLWVIKNAEYLVSMRDGITKVFPTDDPAIHYYIDKFGKKLSSAQLIKLNAQMFEQTTNGYGSEAIADAVSIGPKFQLPESEGLSLVSAKTEYDRMPSAHGAYESTRIGASWSFLTKSQKRPFQNDDFSNVRSFKEGKAAVEVSTNNERGWGYINKSGNWFVKPAFVVANSFSEGMASVAVLAHNARTTRDASYDTPIYGFVDTTGSVAIKPKYIYARSFSEGLAAVQID